MAPNHLYKYHSVQLYTHGLNSIRLKHMEHISPIDHLFKYHNA